MIESRYHREGNWTGAARRAADDLAAAGLLAGDSRRDAIIDAAVKWRHSRDAYGLHTAFSVRDLIAAVDAYEAAPAEPSPAELRNRSEWHQP